ncbi:MAG: TlpA disulfide reductase family protein [Rickettsiales bacterium]
MTAVTRFRVKAFFARPLVANTVRLALAGFLLLYMGYYFKLIDIPAFSRDDPAIEEIAFFDAPIQLGDADAYVDGRRTSLNAADKRFRLGLFWASWCGACKVTIPKTLALLPELQKNGVAVALVATPDSRREVSSGVRADAARLSLKDGAAPLVLEDDGNMLFSRLELRRVPRFVLINKNGEAVAYARLNLNAPDLPATLGALAALNNK